MLYESMLLFGVVFIADALHDVLTESRHALTLRGTRQAWLFLVIGAYFAFFWRRSGQTLAMQTWHIKLVTSHGTRISLRDAIVRYTLSWMWFLPAMAIAWAFGIKGWQSIGLIVAGMLAWMCTVRLDPARQFLHDRIAGTRLVDIRPDPPKRV